MTDRPRVTVHRGVKGVRASFSDAVRRPQRLDIVAELPADRVRQLADLLRHAPDARVSIRFTVDPGGEDDPEAEAKAEQARFDNWSRCFKRLLNTPIEKWKGRP